MLRSPCCDWTRCWSSTAEKCNRGWMLNSSGVLKKVVCWSYYSGGDDDYSVMRRKILDKLGWFLCQCTASLLGHATRRWTTSAGTDGIADGTFDMVWQWKGIETWNPWEAPFSSTIWFISSSQAVRSQADLCQLFCHDTCHVIPNSKRNQAALLIQICCAGIIWWEIELWCTRQDETAWGCLRSS